MAHSVRDFSICDKVAWDMEVYPTLVDGMIARYGSGPFRVVGLRLIPEDAKHRVHPLMVTVEVPGGTHQECAGEWFKKVA